MRVGDLVKVSIDAGKVPGALAALKRFAELERQCGGQVGIVLKEHLNNSVAVKFNNGIIRIISKIHLEIINER